MPTCRRKPPQEPHQDPPVQAVQTVNELQEHVQEVQAQVVVVVVVVPVPAPPVPPVPVPEAQAQ